ncbi:MAG: hypothetical protein JWP69_2359 [Flaviaesturariibacter sp.]|nr:hypothetical protein [Flaviaesturariibacter sp.]
MKKFLLLLSIAGLTSLDSELLAQEIIDTSAGTRITTRVTRKTTSYNTRTRYFYYPEANVYQNPVSGEYWYYDAPSRQWTANAQLPSAIVVDQTPKYTIYYTGADVYRQNGLHQKKYKVKKNGNLKVKPD